MSKRAFDILTEKKGAGRKAGIVQSVKAAKEKWKPFDWQKKVL